ncbi:hypothetical protein LKL81_11205 [Bacillus paranthracis]|uniref:hypothetical protein n=1 Tax=Bacillus TaxID=1386 RepID=UPI00027A0EEC|nr:MULTISPECIES: hypothetical protein [Bacillus]EJR13197.1 hypothetical protein II9_04454 [Bacillus cereus MSX-D12]KMP43464.1 hypothetical protein TU55_17625 [Bacillus cereus]KMP69669.1 hypothetical protein TU61_02405 [Bacillus cereus]MCC2427788.1 hypothetical protein [Bacillus paranthracis]MDC7739377.1 hypothetical protein [Bacillus sp. FF-1]
MLKKWGIILLMFGLIFAGCSSKTDQNEKEEDSEKITEVKNEKEKNKVDENKKGETNKSVETANPATSFGEGMYKVGVDVPSGEYMLIAQNGMGYFSINSSSSSDSILANDNFAGNSIITIENGQYVTINRAKMYPINNAPSLTPVNGILPDGMYIVGKHIPAGEYKITPSSGRMGYFSINSGSTVSQLKNIIENGNFNGERYIKVNNGQYLKINRASIKVDGKISGENVSPAEEIKLTNKQEDGMHFWKAEKEIITGHDWMALSDTEKTKLIQLSMDHIQSDGVVKLKKSNQEYVNLLNKYFSDNSKRNEKIKDIFANIMLEDIQNK